jgi:hypothetical protein
MQGKEVVYLHFHGGFLKLKFLFITLEAIYTEPYLLIFH